MTQNPLFEIIGITKEYPGVIANKDVSFSIDGGSIHALLGENGAGKSTLVKMMYGLVKPTRGEMKFRGKPYHPDKPKYARAQGVGMVFQHFSLFDALSVAENIELGLEKVANRYELSQKIETISKQYGLPLDPRRIVGKLSAGERQRVEIVRCLLQNPKLLVMDEPTSVLTPGEVDILFQTLRKLRDEGVSILYISHKLEEIRSLCDHATILRRGKVVGDCDPREKTARELAELMVGERLAQPSTRKMKHGDILLSVKNVSIPSQHEFGPRMRDLNFELHAGEILGVAGVAGNGQDELLAILTGEVAVEKGSITVLGQDMTKASTLERRSLGLLGAPEERNGHAAVSKMSLVENTMLTAKGHVGPSGALSRRNWLSWRKARDFTSEIVAAYDVRTAGIDVAAGSLSGGNLQKFVIGREMLQNPKVFVVNQPTWGVDAAAASFIREAIRRHADQGAGVIVISQDLDELYEVADHMVVLCEGRLSPKAPMEKMDMQTIGTLMGGGF